MRNNIYAIHSGLLSPIYDWEDLVKMMKMNDFGIDPQEVKSESDWKIYLIKNLGIDPGEQRLLLTTNLQLDEFNLVWIVYGDEEVMKCLVVVSIQSMIRQRLIECEPVIINILDVDELSTKVYKEFYDPHQIHSIYRGIGTNQSAFKSYMRSITTHMKSVGKTWLRNGNCFTEIVILPIRKQK